MNKNKDYPDRETIINAPPKSTTELVRLLAGLPKTWDVHYFSGRNGVHEIDQFTRRRECDFPDHDDDAYDVFNIMLSPPDEQADGLFRIRPKYSYGADAVTGYRVLYSPGTCEDAPSRWYVGPEKWYDPGDIDFENDDANQDSLHSLSDAFQLMQEIIETGDVSSSAAEQYSEITQSVRRARRFENHEEAGT
ncbi:hypothetical protein [Salinibaculum rarum]|uniref:hypothetical protein n=1 Tax=Salinibaculum rarum TaxID=3058903 RepID=UPI00265E6526|nr:hypothetical protein [Salinibaculum sp. KK48]